MLTSTRATPSPCPTAANSCSKALTPSAKRRREARANQIAACRCCLSCGKHTCRPEPSPAGLELGVLELARRVPASDLRLNEPAAPKAREESGGAKDQGSRLPRLPAGDCDSPGGGA